MRKKIHLGQNKDDLHDLGSDDLLSRLSDDILVSILSYLPLKEAAATSKLSRRWRCLWCQTVCLVFEDKEISEKIQMGRLFLDSSEEWNKYNKFCLAEKNKYINWVNRIIRQHKSSTIDEFKIRFDLDKNAKGAIGKWIEFAISKNVQRLELDLSYKHKNLSNYVFPNKIFDKKCGSLLKQSSFDNPFTLDDTAMEMKFLKSLILKRVDVDDEGLKKILSNCPILEHLSIHDSCELVTAKICGKELALKNIEFGGFFSRLRLIEICDSNIVSINCEGSYSQGVPITLRLDNLQKLKKICIGKAYSWKKTDHMFCEICCCIPHLQVLELRLYHPQSAIEILPYPELPKLKQLIVKVEVSDWADLNLFHSLVEACPNLQRLKILLGWSYGMKVIKKYWEVRQAAKQPHQHLEVVEICGYLGLTNDLQASDFELAMYFIENVVALKKLVIQPCTRGVRLGNEIVDEHAARYNAQKQLEPITPAGVELVIL